LIGEYLDSGGEHDTIQPVEPKSQRNRALFSGVLLLVVLILGVFFSRTDLSPHDSKSIDIDSTEAGSKAAVVVPATTPDAISAAEIDVNPVHPAATRSVLTSVARPSRQLVLRLVLDGKTCSLEAVEEVTGDFRSRRDTPEAHAGMIVSRLVSAAGNILAEEFTHPPDHVCTVLDPNPDGILRPVTLAGVGPQVFQVRFPVELRTEQLEVHRITQTEPELLTQLLLSTAIKQ
jgi:hypothetical protein